MSELKFERPVKVGTRAAMMETPVQLCMETHGELGTTELYMEKPAIKVGDILLVKDAP